MCTCGHSAEEHAGGVCYHIMSDECPLWDCRCSHFTLAAGSVIQTG